MQCGEDRRDEVSRGRADRNRIWVKLGYWRGRAGRGVHTEGRTWRLVAEGNKWDSSLPGEWDQLKDFSWGPRTAVATSVLVPVNTEPALGLRH